MTSVIIYSLLTSSSILTPLSSLTSIPPSSMPTISYGPPIVTGPSFVSSSTHSPLAVSVSKDLSQSNSISSDAQTTAPLNTQTALAGANSGSPSLSSMSQTSSAIISYITSRSSKVLWDCSTGTARDQTMLISGTVNSLPTLSVGQVSSSAGVDMNLASSSDGIYTQDANGSGNSRSEASSINIAKPTSSFHDRSTKMSGKPVHTRASYSRHHHPHATDADVWTTVYETFYEAICPTGITTSHYTITETCTGAYTPHAIPPGFTTTIKICEPCKGKPTLTLTCPNKNLSPKPTGNNHHHNPEGPKIFNEGDNQKQVDPQDYNLNIDPAVPFPTVKDENTYLNPAPTSPTSENASGGPSANLLNTAASNSTSTSTEKQGSIQHTATASSSQNPSSSEVVQASGADTGIVGVVGMKRSVLLIGVVMVVGGVFVLL
jgi:hypothetical protein